MQFTVIDLQVDSPSMRALKLSHFRYSVPNKILRNSLFPFDIKLNSKIYYYISKYKSVTIILLSADVTSHEFIF